MQVGVLITDGGPHSAEDWAIATAQHVVNIDKLPSAKMMAGMKLQVAVAEVLVKHHSGVQAVEKGKLAADAENHLQTPLSAEAEADAASAEIVEIAKGTQWNEHFADPDVQAAMRHTLASHFMTSQDIERRWHQDRANTGA